MITDMYSRLPVVTFITTVTLFPKHLKPVVVFKVQAAYLEMLALSVVETLIYPIKSSVQEKQNNHIV